MNLQSNPREDQHKVRDFQDRYSRDMTGRKSGVPLPYQNETNRGEGHMANATTTAQDLSGYSLEAVCAAWRYATLNDLELPLPMSVIERLNAETDAPRRALFSASFGNDESIRTISEVIEKCQELEHEMAAHPESAGDEMVTVDEILYALKF